MCSLQCRLQLIHVLTLQPDAKSFSILQCTVGIKYSLTFRWLTSYSCRYVYLSAKYKTITQNHAILYSIVNAINTLLNYKLQLFVALASQLLYCIHLNIIIPTVVHPMIYILIIQLHSKTRDFMIFNTVLKIIKSLVLDMWLYN